MRKFFPRYNLLIAENAVNQHTLDKKRFDTWSWTVPFIAKKNEAESIVAQILAHRRRSIHGISAYDFGTISGIYSKEYPWGPACESIRDDQWIDLDYQTYEERVENLMSDVIKVPSLDRDSLLLRDKVEEKVKPEEKLKVNIDDLKHDGERSEFMELINMLILHKSYTSTILGVIPRGKSLPRQGFYCFYDTPR